MTVTEAPPLTLGEIVEHLARYVDRFEVGELSPDDAARAATRFGKVKRMAQAAELLCLNRAAATSKVRRRDDVDGSKWAGRQLGTTPGHATELLNLAGGLEAAPQTLEALKAGDISTEQAAEVVRTAKVAPGSERDMLDQAEQSSLSELKRRGRKVRAAAIGPDEQAARVHRGRYLRAWVDDDGAGRGAWSLDLAQHTQFMALVQSQTDLVFEEARREGRRESMDAYRADALVRVGTAALRSSSQRGRRPTSSSSDPAGPSHSQAPPDEAPSGPPPEEPPTKEPPPAPPTKEPPPGPPSGPPLPESPRSGPPGTGHGVDPTRSAAERPCEPPPTDGPTTSHAEPEPGAPAPAEVLVHVSHQLLLEGPVDPRTAASAAGPTSGLGVGLDRPAGGARAGTQLELADLAADTTDAAPPTRTTDEANAAHTTPPTRTTDAAEIVGQGPIPVGVVRQWLGQGAFVAVVVTADDDPLDVRTVLHLGRRSALVRQLWIPEQQSEGRHPGHGRPPAGAGLASAGPDHDTSARHTKVIVQLTEQELRQPTAAPLRTAVRMRGVDVASLVHRGRRPNAVQRTALQWRSPVCAVLGCTNRIRLEADHVIEWCLTRHTTLAELEHLCRQHHRMKTHDGYRLAPGTGKRPLLPPPAHRLNSADP